jgi:Arc/MetJ-type ribon-helix-helix transcriptional regulator
MTTIKQSKHVVIAIRMRRELINQIDQLIEKGMFENRSEAIRTAIRKLIETYTK